MDRAEAIKYLEDCRSQAIHDGVITIGRWRTDVFDMAIAALREQSNANQRNSNASNALTNADHIRAMTDEELSEMLYEADSRKGNADLNVWLEWLQQPCGGAEHE